MAHRLTKIYTRTGDRGETGLGDGTRMPKDAARIEALGCVDELNSQIGLLLTEPLPDNVRSDLTRIQHNLFDLGGELSIPGYVMIGEDHVKQLEDCLDRHNAALPPLKDFILPGGSRPAAIAHLARTVCRRAERSLVRVGRDGSVQPASLQYLNRLSDLLFVLARVLNRAAHVDDILWQRSTPTPTVGRRK